MSLCSARSSPRLHRRIPATAVATEGFLTCSGLGFGPTGGQAFPRPLFSAGRVLSELGELLPPTPGETPENIRTLSEHWNCPTASVKPVQQTDGNKSVNSPVIEIAAAESMYDFFEKIWWGNASNDTSVPAANNHVIRSEAARVQGLPSMLVCSVIGRPGTGQSVPVLQVVGCPTFTSESHRGSPWVETEIAPDNFDGRDAEDFHDIYIGSLSSDTRYRSTAKLNNESVDSRLSEGNFGYSTNGALWTTVLTEPKHEQDLDPVLEANESLRRLLYSCYGDEVGQLSEQDTDLMMDGPTEEETRVVRLPRFIPLPLGTQLPPGILATADIGSERLLRAIRLQWGLTSTEFLTCNLVREWLDAVAERADTFATCWHYVRDYHHLWHGQSNFVNDITHDAFRLAGLRMTARMHCDAMRYAKPTKTDYKISKLLRVIKRVRTILPSDPRVPEGCPPVLRFEAIALLQPESGPWKKLVSGFQLAHAEYMPPFLLDYSPLRFSARTRLENINVAQLAPNQLMLAVDRTPDDDREAQSDDDSAVVPQPDGYQTVVLRKPPPPPSPYRAARLPISQRDSLHRVTQTDASQNSATAPSQKRDRGSSRDESSPRKKRSKKKKKTQHSASDDSNQSSDGSSSASSQSSSSVSTNEQSDSAPCTPPKRSETKTHTPPSRKWYSSALLPRLPSDRALQRSELARETKASRESNANLATSPRHQQYLEHRIPLDTRNSYPPALRILSHMLRTSVPRSFKVFRDRKLRSAVPSHKRFTPLQLSDDFLSLYNGSTSAAQAWIITTLNKVRVLRSRNRWSELNVWNTTDFPEDLVKVYRRGLWGYQHENVPTLNSFSPWSLLALVPGCYEPKTKTVRIPAEGLVYEDALSLAETYCTLVSFAESISDGLGDGCSIALVRAIRLEYMSLMRHTSVFPVQFRSLEDAWNRAVESRVAYTAEFFETLGRLVDTFYTLATTPDNTFVGWIKNKDSKTPRQIEMCRYKFKDGEASLQWNSSKDPELSAHVNSIIRNSLDRFQHGPSIAMVRHGIYVPPAASLPRKSTQTDSKGKAHDAPARNSDGFCVELLRNVKAPSKNMRAVTVARAHPSKKYPTVIVGSNAPVGVCLRAMGSCLFRCKIKNCKLYHFPAQGTRPPADVNLTNLLEFLNDPAVSALVAPTELGEKVLRPL